MRHLSFLNLGAPRLMAVALATSVSFGAVHLYSENASAALLAKESFVYDAGTNLGGLAGGLGWDSSWQSITTANLSVSSGGLDYTGLFSEGLLIPDGNSALRSGTVGNAAAVVRQHSHADAGEPLWFSLLVNVESTSAVGSALRFLPIAAQSVGSASGEVGRGIGFRLDHQGILQAQVGGNLSTGPNVLTLPLDTTSMVVGRIDLPSNLTDPVAIQLWVNPDLGDINSGSGSIFLSAPNMQSALGGSGVVSAFSDLDRSMARFGIEWDGEIDEILFGSTGPVVIMPEPGRAMLLGLAGLFLLARRRR